MEKIIVIGCPGAGKSTFAQKLEKLINIPLYHLDMIWHKPDRTNISKDEFDKKVGEIIKQDKWIIDGNYQRTLEMRFKACDTIFLMDLPVELCIEGAKGRIGKKRGDLPWLEASFDKEFEQFILDFPKEKLPKIYELLEKYKDNKNIIIFKSREEADKYLQNYNKGDE